MTFTTTNMSSTDGDSLVNLLGEYPTTGIPSAGVDLTTRRVAPTVLGSALAAPLEDPESPIFILARELSEESTGDSGMDSDLSDDTPAWTPGVIEAAVRHPLTHHVLHQPQLPGILEPKLEAHQPSHRGALLGPEYSYGTGSDSDGPMTPPLTATAPDLKAIWEQQTVYRPRQATTPAERKTRKMASNRRAAQKFRLKKKAEFAKVFAIIAKLEEQNAAMQRELTLIKSLRQQ